MVLMDRSSSEGTTAPTTALGTASRSGTVR
jgi:hypothetical protein